MKKTKITIATTALILTLTIAVTITTCLPIVNAEGRDTYAYMSASPDPIGVNQPITLVFWLNLMPPTARYWEYEKYLGYEVTVWKPDGTTQKLGPWESDPVGAGWTQYTPDQAGTYEFQFSYPGQTFPETPRSDEVYYKASVSRKVSVTVQEDPIEYLIPAIPLPEDYWERPINIDNRDWWSISGNWLGMNRGCYNITQRSGFNPYTTAPNTAHIVWTKEIAFGGLIGGEFGSKGYYFGLSYEPMFTPPIIMHGRLYYNRPLPPRYGFYCVDLRTGEEIWFQNATNAPDALITAGSSARLGHNVERYGMLSFGQIYDYESPNQHGGIPYLWSGGSTWSMYDAFTGELILSLANATGGRGLREQVVMSSDGEVLLYQLDGRNNWLAMWNSSKCIPPPDPTSTGGWQWRPDNAAEWRGKLLNWQDG